MSTNPYDDDLDDLAARACEAQERIGAYRVYGPCVQEPDAADFAVLAEWKRRYKEGQR
jgi:hypothetical protein